MDYTLYLLRGIGDMNGLVGGAIGLAIGIVAYAIKQARKPSASDEDTRQQ